MATSKQRKICKVCKVKSVIDKMQEHNGFWYHNTCKVSLPNLGTTVNRCPTSEEFLTPQQKIIAEKFSTPFWLDIRNATPISFLLYMQNKYPEYLWEKYM